MRILHFIPEIKENRDVWEEYYNNLTTASEDIEMRIITTDEHISNAERMPGFAPSFKSKLYKIIEEFHPDIIHIHGCTGTNDIRVSNAAEKYRIPTIVSPAGSLTGITLAGTANLHQRAAEALRAYKILSRADAIHVTGSMDSESIRKLNIVPASNAGVSLLNKTILIKNSVLTNAITHDDMRRLFKDLYIKICGLRVGDIMRCATRECERIILRNGICAEYCENSSDDIEIVSNTDAEELEKIFIHAELENVRDFIDKGCRTLGITYSPDRNACREKAGLEALQSDGYEPLFKNMKKARAKNRSIIRDFENYEKESDLFCTVAYAKHLLENGTLSFRHLAFITDKLIHTEYREDIVLKIFRDAKMLGFASRLMQIMHDYAALPEGYMPVAPVQDSKTKDILTCLTSKQR